MPSNEESLCATCAESVLSSERRIPSLLLGSDNLLVYRLEKVHFITIVFNNGIHLKSECIASVVALAIFTSSLVMSIACALHNKV